MFVAMPFTLIRWPSLSLGLLKSILLKDGIHCGVTYCNLLFADQVGLDAFLFAENGWTRTFLCDWLFQRRVFPNAAYPAGRPVKDHREWHFTAIFLKMPGSPTFRRGLKTCTPKASSP